MIIGALIPLYVSSYGIVGEKVEKSMEPLLSTPTTDGEILMGKCIGTLLPTLLSVYLGAAVYMSLIDALTASDFGYFFFPNWAFRIILLVGVSVTATYAITLSVFISSKVNSVMAAYQGGGVTLVPFLIIYVMGEIGIVKLDDTSNILIVSAVLLIVAVVMYFISRETFGREKILTEWK
jgi:ABC-type Na+ efflux pump permease subunit